MSTQATANLSEMLREYAPHTLIQDKFKKDNFVWNAFEMDKSWKNGASYQIPWELSEASDMEMGALVAEGTIGDVGSYKKVVLNDQPELWGALKLHEKDLTRYGDLRQSFLKIFPDKLEALIDRMKMSVSCIILRNGAIATATGNGSVGGVIAVDKPQFFTIGQRVRIHDADTSVIGYINQINMNAKTLLVHTTRTSGVALDLSGVTVAAGGAISVPGSDTENFSTLAKYLLPASLGGSDSIHGVSKLSSPLLQPQLFDGSSITADNVLDKLYDHYFSIKELGKVKKADMWVPYHILKAAIKKSQVNKDYLVGDREAGYGFSRVKLLGPDGDMTLTALADMPSNVIYMPDQADFVFAGDKFFDRKRQLNNEEFFTIRKTTGYEHVVDICARFEFIAKKLSSSAAIHSVPTL